MVLPVLSHNKFKETTYGYKYKHPYGFKITKTMNLKKIKFFRLS